MIPQSGDWSGDHRGVLARDFGRHRFGIPPTAGHPLAKHRRPAPGALGGRTRVRSGRRPAPANAASRVHRSGPLPRPGPGEPSRRPEQRGAEPAAASPGELVVLNQIRSSELVPTRKVPPLARLAPRRAPSTFGLLNLGQSPDERAQAELEAKVRSLLRGPLQGRRACKGGTGKTTIAAKPWIDLRRAAPGRTGWWPSTPTPRSAKTRQPHRPQRRRFLLGAGSDQYLKPSPTCGPGSATTTSGLVCAGR